MSTMLERGELHLPKRPSGWRRLLPAWYARARLRANEREIDRLESQLASEFGLLETMPMQLELEALVNEREALERKQRRA